MGHSVEQETSQSSSSTVVTIALVSSVWGEGLLFGGSTVPGAHANVRSAANVTYVLMFPNVNAFEEVV